MSINTTEKNRSLIDLYSSKEYQCIFDIAQTNYPMLTDCEMYILGLSLFEVGFIKDSIHIIQSVINNGFSEDISIGLTYLALGYYSIGDYYSSQKWIKTACLYSGEYTSEAYKWNSLLHLSIIESPSIIETDSLRFHFVDAFTSYNKESYILQCERAFSRVHDFFTPTPTKKIDIYVYDRRTDDIGGRLSYSIPSFATIHVNPLDECGHELTHVLTHYIPGGIKYKNRFVDEGVAECFNDIICIYDNDVHPHTVNLADIWDNYDSYGSHFARRFARLFFSNLILAGGKEKILALIHDQRMENAIYLYGDLLFEAQQNAVHAIMAGKYHQPF